MKFIHLTQNKEAIVDDDVFEYLNQWKWYFTSRKTGIGYATRDSWVDGIRKHLYMHRVILNADDDFVDHVNKNGLDNRRENIRKCSSRQNSYNTVKNIGKNNHGYRGVQYFSYDVKRRKRWYARIRVNGSFKHLGYYHTPEEAALAYNEAAIKYHGVFATSNSIPSEILDKPREK